MLSHQKRPSTAVIVGSEPGIGGLGLQCEFALKALSALTDVDAIGPRFRARQRLRVQWRSPSLVLPPWACNYTPLRWTPGLCQEIRDRQLGRFAAGVVAESAPRSIYAFTQIAEESLRFCVERGIPAILDSPNGHIRNFRRTLDEEARELLGRRDLSHPTSAVVDRVEREYALAPAIRVASNWARSSLVSYGLNPGKVHVFDLAVDCARFSPPRERRSGSILSVCFVGSVDLRKGVVYLLRGLRAFARHVRLQMVGGTGSRGMAMLIEREAKGLNWEMAPGNPVPAYQSADIFVLPSLEDGFGYAAAEAMACGVPAIVTNQCGVSEWITDSKSGWIIRPRSPKDIAVIVEEALDCRPKLAEMGAAARAAVLKRMEKRPEVQMGQWALRTLDFPGREK